MILPDSSIWIDFFNGQETPKTQLLNELLGKEVILTGDIILTEVLQGFRHERDLQHAQEILFGLPFQEMLGQKVALQSAKNYRFLRQRGITIRNTIDVMIATFCIVNQITLLQNDRDFAPMIEHLNLMVL
jgi:predicted nucleic acid-binding protein